MTRHAAATRYARALFDVALRESDVVKVGDELDGFAGMVGTIEEAVEKARKMNQ